MVYYKLQMSGNKFIKILYIIYRYRSIRTHFL